MKCSACGKTNLRKTTTALIVPDGKFARCCTECISLYSPSSPGASPLS